MTRTFLAFAAALFAATTFFSSGANACISCEYVPPVVNTPVYSHGAKHYKRARAHSAAKVRRARAAKRRMLEAKAAARAKAQAKAQAQAKAKTKLQTAKTAPVETEVESENSAISTASVDKNGSAKVELEPAKDPQVSKNITCKKFFPTVGMTLTVPCE